VDLARPFLVLPAGKIEIENSLEWPCPKRKAVARGNFVFGSVEPCELVETRTLRKWIKVGFVRAASFQRRG